MRIGLFVSDFPLLSETFVSTLAADLRAAGHDLQVMARDLPEGSLGAVHPDVAAAPFPVSRSVPSGRLPLARAVDLIRDSPRRAHLLAALWALDRVAGGKRTMVTRHLAGLEPFDIVHAQFATLGETAQRHRDYGTLRTRALVVHLRGYDITSFARMHGPHAFRRAFARAELFVANCDAFRDIAIELGCPEDRCIVIGSPIDTDRFSPPAIPRGPYEKDRPLRLVAVGRLVEKKGFADAVRAVAILRANGRDVRLDILGEGEERAALERIIAEENLGDAVRLHGAATQTQILAALHGADIGLAPSVTAGAGDKDAPVNTLKEKMATGLPVVATDHGGIPELVRDGHNGLLVPERDSRALAAAIEALATAPESWARMGKAGRADVVEMFERGRIARRTVDAYHRALRIAEGRGP